jgi:hypothetical protein
MVNGLGKGNLVFGGTERVEGALCNAGADGEAEIRISCKKNSSLP